MLSEYMYQENILEHYKSPHNFGTLPSANASAKESNPLCGDVMELQLKVEDGVIRAAKFSGKGCAISIASASMLTDELRGKTVEEAKKLDKEHVLEMLGVPVSPGRQKSAFLSLKTLKIALMTKEHV